MRISKGKFALDAFYGLGLRACSKTFAQQGRSRFCALGVPSVREHGKWRERRWRLFSTGSLCALLSFVASITHHTKEDRPRVKQTSRRQRQARKMIRNTRPFTHLAGFTFDGSQLFQLK